jgi:hypothetical protein
MTIEYDYAGNVRWHWPEGPKAAIPHLFAGHLPASLLDVGCGPGIWLKAVLECGVPEALGVDGIELPCEQFVAPRQCFRKQDLATSWDLGRRFEAALCLEVAEHLEPEGGEALIKSLTLHADRIFFSAACPNQLGQHHVNCQWPAYWQRLFNQHGYACSDDIRWRIWNLSRVEPWYRQNMFIASRDPQTAGYEKRLDAVVHPEMLQHLDTSRIRSEVLEQIERGNMITSWYLRAGFRAFMIKLRRIPTRLKRLAR